MKWVRILYIWNKKKVKSNLMIRVAHVIHVWKKGILHRTPENKDVITAMEGINIMRILAIIKVKKRRLVFTLKELQKKVFEACSKVHSDIDSVVMSRYYITGVQNER